MPLSSVWGWNEWRMLGRAAKRREEVVREANKREAVMKELMKRGYSRQDAIRLAGSK